ncbi:MAG: hypothetical protein U9N34_06585 [Candidatus Cloacimonadota bacterium]|nr:hypothetical protein [Candidatus Cloacimonadota bacterium]
MKKINLSIFILLILFSFVYAQKFDINKFSEHSKYGWDDNDARISFRDSLLQKQQLLQIYHMKVVNPKVNLLKAATFPGWGHFSAQSITKGQVFLSINLTLLGSGYYFYDKMIENYEKYESASQIDEINKYYDQALTPYKFVQIISGLYFLFWSYNIYDVSMETERYNTFLWEQIINNKKITITPVGINVRF